MFLHRESYEIGKGMDGASQTNLDVQVTVQLKYNFQCTLRSLIEEGMLINFSIFSDPPELIWNPPSFINFYIKSFISLISFVLCSCSCEISAKFL